MFIYKESAAGAYFPSPRFGGPAAGFAAAKNRRDTLGSGGSQKKNFHLNLPLRKKQKPWAFPNFV
jgi:hypothetical protein